MDVEALCLLGAQRDELKRLPNPDGADMTFDKYDENNDEHTENY